MTSAPSPDSMGGTPAALDPLALALALPRQPKVVLVMDLVESVRLMAANEAAVVGHWRAFVQHATGTVLPRHHGRMVKSLGDGLLVEFDSAAEAVAAAVELHRHFEPHNARCPADERLYLRAGLNATQVFVDDIDIYGSGVNLAARVANLAGPGETVVTAAVRDHLTHGLHGELEDLGECFLKHVSGSIRVYRVGACGPAPILPDRQEYVSGFVPSVAVIPFAALGADSPHALAFGDALADDVIAALSATSNVRVIARLSTAPLRGAPASVAEIGRLLSVDYVVSGSYALSGRKATVRVQLCSTRDSVVLWADGMTVHIADVFAGQDPIIPAIAANVGQAILQRELERARLLPIPVLEKYTLYIGSVAMLHRLSRADFYRAKELLDHLAYLFPRSSAPHAVLSKWHVMNALQGWSQDFSRTTVDADACADRALALDGDNALALAMKAFNAAHFRQDPAAAGHYAVLATQANAQELHGWLALVASKAYSGNALGVEADAALALSLSPLDPARYMCETFVAAAKLTAGKHEEAAASARASIRLNAMHLPAHRLLTIALVLADDMPAAREAAQALLRIQPSFRVQDFARRYPGRNSAHAAQFTAALLEAGLPG